MVADKADMPNSFVDDSHSETVLMKSQDVALLSMILYSVNQGFINLSNPSSVSQKVSLAWTAWIENDTRQTRKTIVLEWVEES